MVTDQKVVAEMVLQQLRERGDMEGYQLMRNTGLSIEQLRPAIEQLASLGQLRFRGVLQGQGLAEAWYTVRQATSKASGSYYA